jgi:hypothetical protein
MISLWIHYGGGHKGIQCGGGCTVTKNWLFANTVRGAKVSAIIYSIVETAKENDLNPFDYLKYTLERIKNIVPTAIDSLLPWSQDVQAALRIHSNTASS